MGRERDTREVRVAVLGPTSVRRDATVIDLGPRLRRLRSRVCRPEPALSAIGIIAAVVAPQLPSSAPKVSGGDMPLGRPYDATENQPMITSPKPATSTQEPASRTLLRRSTAHIHTRTGE